MIPSRRQRALASIAVALVAGGLALWIRTRVTGFSDFDVIWLAGRALARGANPYVAIKSDVYTALHYPLPAVVMALPFSALPESLAAAAWTALGFGLLAYFLSAAKWWPLISLASLPAVDAAQLAQWSPVLTCIGLAPALGFLAIAKPTTGGALVVSYASRVLEKRPLMWSAGIALLVVLAATTMQPNWPWQWASSVRGAYHFVPLVLRPGGFLLLAALLKWRRPEARLLALLALAPQTGAPYDALPLILALASQREAFVFAALSFVFVLLRQTTVGPGGQFTAELAHNAPYLLATIYFPVLIMLLRRPNEGPAPMWVENTVARLPHWLRGRTSAVAAPLASR